MTPEPEEGAGVEPETEPGARPPRLVETAGGHMLEALVCPATGAPLAYDRAAQELVSKAAGLAYPIRSGIPIMLIAEARRIEP